MRCMSGCRVCSHLTREKYNSGEKTLNFKYSLYSYIHNTNQNFQIINSNEEEYWALQAVTTCSLIVMAIPTPNLLLWRSQLPTLQVRIVIQTSLSLFTR